MSTTTGTRPRRPRTEARLPGLLALTLVTGLVDASTFIALGGVFSAMMTGNVIFLGLGIAGSVDFAISGPLIAIASYVTGAAAASRAEAGSRGHLPRPVFGTRVGAGVPIALLIAATLLAAATEPRAGSTSGYVVLALLAASMGWRTEVLRALGSVNVPTTVLNLTFVPAPNPPNAEPADGSGRPDLHQRALAIVSLLAGAVLGGLLLEIDLWVPLALAALISIAVAPAIARSTR